MFAGKPEHSCILAPVASDSHEPRAELSVKLSSQKPKLESKRELKTNDEDEVEDENRNQNWKPKTKPKPKQLLVPNGNAIIVI